MSCNGCIFEEVGSVNEPCLLCKRNPDDNREDNYYQHGGFVDFVENILEIKLMEHQKILLAKAAAKRGKDKYHGCSTCKYGADIIRYEPCYNCDNCSNWERKE